MTHDPEQEGPHGDAREAAHQGGYGEVDRPEHKPELGYSITSTVCGIISIFFLAPIFSTIALIFGGIGLSQREYVMSTIGIITALLGLLTSPMFWGFLGMGTAISLAS